MRKWILGTISLAIIAVSTIVITFAEDYSIDTIAITIMLFCIVFGLGLIVSFMYPRILGWTKSNFSKLSVEERLVRTRVITIYECGNCQRQYNNIQVCPFCGSPYRRTVKETTEQEITEKWNK